MTSCIQFGQSPPTPTAVYPIPAVEMRVINSDPYRQQEKGLIRTTIPGGGTMWIHPDLLDEVAPWTTVSRKKSRDKNQAGECHHRLHHRTRLGCQFSD